MGRLEREKDDDILIDCVYIPRISLKVPSKKKKELVQRDKNYLNNSKF